VDQTSERRNFYRINDVVGLTYRVLGEEEDAWPSKSTTFELPVTNLLAEIDHEFNQAANIIWHENPTVAKALGLLNKKLSIIAAHSIQDEDQSVNSYEEMMINISGCGMAFDCTENISPGTRLEIILVLQPSNTQIEITGEVITTKHLANNTDKPYSVRVNFDENNATQEQLIQHIVQKQCAQVGSKSKKKPISEIV
jgi:c-di-GMP-binding flagellar brake protein YcgR